MEDEPAMRHVTQRLRRYGADERGITGLETAIILIAFVVVASVFAFTVLSAGIFSSEKGKEAIHAGLQGTRSAMKIVGPVVAKDTDNDDNVDEVIFMISTSAGGEAVSLTTTTDSDSDGFLSDEASPLHTTTVHVFSASEAADDVAWTRVDVGKGDGDVLLEKGEVAEITVDVSGFSPRIAANSVFTTEMRLRTGATLIFERTIPSSVDKVMSLR